MSNPFVKAIKEQTKLRMALFGPSGSGKTWTALELATRLVELEGGKIAFIDTEGRSARKYASDFTFDVLDLSGNYDPKEYIKGIAAAVENNYTVLVIDSLSHAWNGAGGVLNIVDKAASKFNNSKFSGWSEGRPAHNALVEAITNSPIHIIGTIRAKTDYALQTDERGKSKPVEIGIAPIQDGDFKYEFDLTIAIDRDHVMTIDTSRCRSIPMDAEITDSAWMMDTLHAWLTDGAMPVWHNRRDSKNWLQVELRKRPHVDGNAGFKQIDPNATRWTDLHISEAELLKHLNELNQPTQEDKPVEPPAPAEPKPAKPAVRGKGNHKPDFVGAGVTIPFSAPTQFSDEEIEALEQDAKRGELEPQI